MCVNDILRPASYQLRGLLLPQGTVDLLWLAVERDTDHDGILSFR